MFEVFTPSAWEGIGVVTLMLIFGALWVVAQLRGWIVMGPTHDRELASLNRELDSRDREIKELSEANQEHFQAHSKKDQTILELSEAARASTVAGEATLKALETAKELYGGAR